MAVQLGDSTLLEIGSHCFEPSCNQLDFLPIKCPYCHHVFCQEHWRPGSKEHGHPCAVPDNVVTTPACPLCNVPVAVDKGQDPNIAMDQHLSSNCPVLDAASGLAAKPKGKAKDLCAARGCHTKLVAVSINCDKCHRDYCAKHRMPADHACSTTALPAPQKKSSFSGKVFSKRASNAPIASTSKLQQPGLAALRRAKESAAQRLGGSKETAIDLDDSDIEIVSSSKGPSKPSLGIAISKTDRRAKAERANAIKSLEGRAAKGLLTDDQKVELATLKAKDKRSGDLKDDSCRVT